MQGIILEVGIIIGAFLLPEYFVRWKMVVPIGANLISAIAAGLIAQYFIF